MKKVLVVSFVFAFVFAGEVCAQKFGHVNQAQIVQAMPEYTAAQTEIQTLAKQYEEELKRMQDELQTKMTTYEKDAATLPDAVKQRREQELQELNQRLQQYYQSSQEDLEQKRTEKLSEIGEKVQKAIKEVGTAGGYVYIMDINSLPFINEGLSTDVTDEVKAKLGIQ